MTKNNTPEAGLVDIRVTPEAYDLIRQISGSQNITLSEAILSLQVPEADSGGEFREKLIDKLDDQRFGDNLINKKLLYKDVEWIVDELIEVFDAHNKALYKKLLAEIDALKITESESDSVPFSEAYNHGLRDVGKVAAKVFKQDIR